MAGTRLRSHPDDTIRAMWQTPLRPTDIMKNLPTLLIAMLLTALPACLSLIHI